MTVVAVVWVGAAWPSFGFFRRLGVMFRDTIFVSTTPLTPNTSLYQIMAPPATEQPQPELVHSV